MPHKFRRPVTLGLMIAIACVAATPALASSGGSLPWEGPLQTIQESITGPVAGFIALAAVAVAVESRARRTLAGIEWRPPAALVSPLGAREPQARDAVRNDAAYPGFRRDADYRPGEIR